MLTLMHFSNFHLYTLDVMKKAEKKAEIAKFIIQIIYVK